MTSPGLLILNCKIFYSEVLWYYSFNFSLRRWNTEPSGVLTVSDWASGVVFSLWENTREQMRAGRRGNVELQPLQRSLAEGGAKGQQLFGSPSTSTSILALAQISAISISYKYTRADLFCPSLKGSFAVIASALNMGERPCPTGSSIPYPVEQSPFKDKAHHSLPCREAASRRNLVSFVCIFETVAGD